MFESVFFISKLKKTGHNTVKWRSLWNYLRYTREYLLFEFKIDNIIPSGDCFCEDLDWSRYVPHFHHYPPGPFTRLNWFQLPCAETREPSRLVLNPCLKPFLVKKRCKKYLHQCGVKLDRGPGWPLSASPHALRLTLTIHPLIVSPCLWLP